MTQAAPLRSASTPRFQSLRNIAALILREMGSTYGRSPGGYLWALIEPMGTVILLSALFAFIIKTPSLGVSFVLFYATGYLPFSLFSNVSGKTLKALQYSRPLLAYPRVSWIDAIMARVILNGLTGVTVFVILISGILIIEDTRTHLTLGPIAVGICAVLCIATAVGTINCLLRSLFPIWDQIWGILRRPLFLASCVFYVFEDLPQPAQSILWWNPLAHASGLIRSGFYSTYEPAYVSLTFVFGTSLSVLAFALLLLRRHHLSALSR